MNPDLVNLYIERLLKEMTDLIKIKVLLETQLQYLEKINISLNEELEKIKKTDEKPSKKNQKVKDENADGGWAKEMSS